MLSVDFRLLIPARATPKALPHRTYGGAFPKK